VICLDDKHAKLNKINTVIFSHALVDT